MWEKIKGRFFTVPENVGPRDNNLNLIRLISALMVIYGHMCHLIGVPVVSVFGQEVSTVAVKIFMALSGYLVSQSFMRDRNALRYGIKRAFRLMPGLIFLVLLTVFIFGPLLSTMDPKEYFSSPGTWDYLKNILLSPRYPLPGVFTSNIYPNAVNGSLWTLPAEAFLYVLVAVVVWFLYKIRCLKPGLVICMVLTLTLNMCKLIFFPELRVVFWGSNIPDWFSLAAFFFMGTLYNFPNVRKLLNLQWAVLLIAILLMLQLSYTKSEFFLIFLLPYFIFSAAFVPRPVFSKWFAKNDYSYGTYLYGFLIQQTVVQLLWQYQFSLNVLFVISSIISVAFAILSWHLVEKPGQKLGARILNTKWMLQWKREPIEIK